MVDFDNEAIITKPAKEIMRVIIIQRRHDLINAMELYNTEQSLGVNRQGLSSIRAKAFSLTKELKGDIQRKLDLLNNNYTYDLLMKDIIDNDKDKLFYAVDFILETLDPLTRITEKKRIL